MIEIEVTDPTHPLFGRRFPVRQIGDTQRGATHVFVAYREYMTLRIPLHMTTLIPIRPATPTKLTLDAVQELVSLAEQEHNPCQHDLPTSGTNCQQIFSSKSATNSDPSSKRS